MNLLKFNVFCNGKFKRYWYLYFYIGYSYTYYGWKCNFKCLQLIQSVIWKESHLLQPVACIHVDAMNVNYLNYFLEWLIDDVRRKTWIWYIGQGQGLAFKDLYVLSAALKNTFTMERSVSSVVYSYHIIYFKKHSHFINCYFKLYISLPKCKH